MAISDQLTLLNNTKTAIRTAINNRGGSVGASDTFASYATAITNLPSGGDDSTLIDLIERDITTLSIPSGTTTIGRSAFQNCSTLTSVTIPNTVTSIREYAFGSCGKLTSVTIPNTVTSIGTYAFSGVARERIMDSIEIPGSVNYISDYMFSESTHVKHIILNEGTTSIGQRAFYSTGLQNITIPSTVTSIGKAICQSCSSMQYVLCLPTTPPTLPSFDSQYDYPFGLSSATYPIYVPAESVDTYKTATRWSYFASRIYPIAQVATVDGNPVYNYEIGNTDSTVITDTERSKIPTGDSIEFAEGLEQIGGQLGAYEEVILPSTFKSFDDTQSINAATTTLTCKATIPPGVEGSNLGGSGLTAIYVPSANVDTYKAASGWSTYADRIQAIPEDVKPAFKFTSSVDSSKDITVNCEDTETAGTLAANDLGMSSQQMDEFRSAENAGSVEIGDCVKIYRATNCYTAKGISEVRLNEGLERIEDFAFGGMSALREITIPSTVTNISYQAFYGDRALRGITCLATTPPTLGSDVFGDTNNCPIYVPFDSVDAYKSAWPQYADRIEPI